MKIRFKETRLTVRFGPVKENEIKDLPKDEAQAFIKNGVAEKVKETKEK